MAILENDNRLKFVPFADASKRPDDILSVIVDEWWVCHPEKGLVYVGADWAPQCNISKDVSAIIRSKLYPWAELRQIPIAYRPASRASRMAEQMF